MYERIDIYTRIPGSSDNNPKYAYITGTRMSPTLAAACRRFAGSTGCNIESVRARWSERGENVRLRKGF